MKYFQKVWDFEVQQLVLELGQHPELWDAHRQRKDAPGSPHTQMSDIWVRYNDLAKFKDGDLSRLNDEHFPVWYPAWRALPSLRPLIFNLMALVEGEHLGGVLITRIPHGCGIDPHVDRSWHVDFYDKFYVSLQSAPGAVLCCGGEELNPVPGECWRFDNRLEHWVRNTSGQDRMTLIICIRTEKFR